MDVFRTPDERFEGLPDFDFEPNYAEIDGLRLSYLDEGEGDPIVCFHGEPTWSFLYRKMIPVLTGGGHRVIAPEYPGFGRSDKPTDRDWYSYDRFCEYTSKLLATLEDLHDATVVVQDWGGPIGLRWAVENQDRVGRLVILNTGIFTAESKPSEAFMAWRNYAARNPDLDVAFIINSGTFTELSQEVRDAYTAPWPNAESKAGVAQFPQLVPLTSDDPTAKQMKRVADELSAWQKPALVCFSDSDPIFTPGAGQFMVDMIPGAGELVVIEGGAHFLQEDKGEQIAGEINSFLESATLAQA